MWNWNWPERALESLVSVIEVTKLRSDCCMICLHGWGIGSDFQCQCLLLVAMQMLQPRFSIFLEVEPMSALRVPPDLHAERDICLMSQMLPPAEQHLKWQRTATCLKFLHSREIVAQMCLVQLLRN